MVVILQSLGQLEEAASLLKKAIDVNPNNPDYNYNLSVILLKQGQLEEAEIFSRKSIELQPNFVFAYSNLGIILRGLGHLKEAEITLRKAIGMKPDYADVYCNLGLILSDLGQIDGDHRKLQEAASLSRKAIELKPDGIDAFNNLGSILNHLGELEEAQVIIRKAIQLQPDNALAHSNLGSILKDQGQLEDAKLCWLKAIEINPNFAVAYGNLGTVLVDQGKQLEAIDYMKKSIEIDSTLEKSYFELGQQLYLRGEYQSAIEYLEKKDSERCKSLHLGCLLSLDKQEEFHKMYALISHQKICNPEIGAIADHSNVIYKHKVNSTFCNESMNYVVVERIGRESFSEEHRHELIAYLKENENNARSQALLNNGLQSSGNLFARNYPFIVGMRDAIEKQIEKYKLKFKDSGEGFIKNWPKQYYLNTWAITMKKGGFLRKHNHTHGWLSGSFYIHVPKREKDDDAGNISFTYEGPDYPSKGTDFDSITKNIETRDICIFPSSLFHQTIPFESEEERICFVFDVNPKL